MFVSTLLNIYIEAQIPPKQSHRGKLYRVLTIPVNPVERSEPKTLIVVCVSPKKQVSFSGHKYT